MTLVAFFFSSSLCHFLSRFQMLVCTSAKNNVLLSNHTIHLKIVSVTGGHFPIFDIVKERNFTQLTVGVCVCQSVSVIPHPGSSCSTRKRRRRTVTFPAYPNTSPARHVFCELTVCSQMRWHQGSAISTILLVDRKYLGCISEASALPCRKRKRSGLLQIWDIEVRISFCLKKQNKIR